mmetsp:Transcript_45077/g.105307  ORF Transcript_45077/g.105307 Transcript_45077/m.105307 type:complete len:217 (+) Transcript_45077:66-716(+)
MPSARRHARPPPAPRAAAPARRAQGPSHRHVPRLERRPQAAPQEHREGGLRGGAPSVWSRPVRSGRRADAERGWRGDGNVDLQCRAPRRGWQVENSCRLVRATGGHDACGAARARRSLRGRCERVRGARCSRRGAAALCVQLRTRRGPCGAGALTELVELARLCGVALAARSVAATRFSTAKKNACVVDATRAIKKVSAAITINICEHPCARAQAR